MSRKLFLDDRHIARLDGLKLRAHPAEKFDGNPVLKQEYPWEHNRAQIGGQSVIYDPDVRRFRMYYMGNPGRRYPPIRINGKDKPGHSTLTCYAESDDGWSWRKPFLGQCSFNDHPTTNIMDIFPGQSGERAGVFFDERDSDPSKRYKMLAWDQKALLLPDGELHHEGSQALIKDAEGNIVGEDTYNEWGNNWGVEYAYSADGIRWTRYADGPVIRCYNDTGTSIVYDEWLRRYVAFGRFNKGGTFTTTDVVFANRTGQAFNVGRSVARVESDDFIHWTEPELVIAADSEDPRSLQIDSMPTAMYEGLYIGMMEGDCRPFTDSHQPVRLAVSRDGRFWDRVAERAAFLDCGSNGEWDDTAVRPGSGAICRGDRIFFFYSGISQTGSFQIGVASWRRDGFVSLSAEGAGGELLTRPFVPTGAELHLNVNASDGEAVVQVCDSQGRPFEGWENRYKGATDNTINPQVNADDRPTEGWGVSELSRPVRGDHLDARVRWDRDDFFYRVGKPVSLRIRLKNAELYSFWTE